MKPRSRPKRLRVARARLPWTADRLATELRTRAGWPPFIMSEVIARIFVWTDTEVEAGLHRGGPLGDRQTPSLDALCALADSGADPCLIVDCLEVAYLDYESLVPVRRFLQRPHTKSEEAATLDQADAILGPVSPDDTTRNDALHPPWDPRAVSLAFAAATGRSPAGGNALDRLRHVMADGLLSWLAQRRPREPLTRDDVASALHIAPEFARLTAKLTLREQARAHRAFPSVSAESLGKREGDHPPPKHFVEAQAAANLVTYVNPNRRPGQRREGMTHIAVILRAVFSETLTGRTWRKHPAIALTDLLEQAPGRPASTGPARLTISDIEPHLAARLQLSDKVHEGYLDAFLRPDTSEQGLYPLGVLCAALLPPPTEKDTRTSSKI